MEPTEVNVGAPDQGEPEPGPAPAPTELEPEPTPAADTPTEAKQQRLPDAAHADLVAVEAGSAVVKSPDHESTPVECSAPALEPEAEPGLIMDSTRTTEVNTGAQDQGEPEPAPTELEAVSHAANQGATAATSAGPGKPTEPAGKLPLAEVAAGKVPEIDLESTAGAGAVDFSCTHAEMAQRLLSAASPLDGHGSAQQLPWQGKIYSAPGVVVLIATTGTGVDGSTSAALELHQLHQLALATTSQPPAVPHAPTSPATDARKTSSTTSASTIGAHSSTPQRSSALQHPGGLASPGMALPRAPGSIGRRTARSPRSLGQSAHGGVSATSVDGSNTAGHQAQASIGGPAASYRVSSPSLASHSSQPSYATGTGADVAWTLTLSSSPPRLGNHEVPTLVWLAANPLSAWSPTRGPAEPSHANESLSPDRAWAASPTRLSLSPAAGSLIGSASAVAGRASVVDQHASIGLGSDQSNQARGAALQPGASETASPPPIPTRLLGAPKATGLTQGSAVAESTSPGGGAGLGISFLPSLSKGTRAKSWIRLQLRNDASSVSTAAAAAGAAQSLSVLYYHSSDGDGDGAEGGQLGPVALTEALELIERELIVDATPVWSPGMGGWSRLEDCFARFAWPTGSRHQQNAPNLAA